MARLTEVQVGAEPPARLEPIIGRERAQELAATAERAARALAGRRIWNINSTASGGGVAEMLLVLVAYARGAGVDTRWLVASGTPEFFGVTKQLHNMLHAAEGARLPDGADEVYDAVSTANAEALAGVIEPDDIVLLHDPQTAGLVGAVKELGAAVVWRCHVGTDDPGPGTRTAWDFLRPRLEPADRYVFSRAPHVHGWMSSDDVTIIPPSIDPLAPKNQPLEPDAVAAILGVIGLVPDHQSVQAANYRRRDGSPASVTRRATLVRGRALPGPDTPMVLQVSRWDRLKDMEGVLRAFAVHVPAPAELALVGPSVEGVTDDPEGPEVLDECATVWDGLPTDVADRVRLVTLPMEDVDENAAMVNALQRHATVVVQKSLQEGFGLTVSEAMIKGRPIVASRVGGIQDQIEHDVSGVLIDDPGDLDRFGRVVRDLVADHERRRRLGEGAYERVVDQFVADRHLTQYAELFAQLDEQGDGAAAPDAAG